MAQTFNPEILEKIFIALTYFRTWVMLFLFPLVILIPDFAFNYCLSIYFPSPMDIVIYNEQEFKLNKKEINSTPVPDIVVFPFNDEDINLKPTKKLSDENLSMDRNIEVKEIKLNQEKLSSKLNVNSKLNFRNEGKVREPESDRNPINTSKPQLSKNHNDKQYNTVDFNQPEEPIEQVKEKVLQKELTKDKKSKKKESKPKKNKNGDIAVPESKRKVDSQFSDVDFEMMEGKFIFNFNNKKSSF